MGNEGLNLGWDGWSEFPVEINPVGPTGERLSWLVVFFGFVRGQILEVRGRIALRFRHISRIAVSRHRLSLDS